VIDLTVKILKTPKYFFLCVLLVCAYFIGTAQHPISKDSLDILIAKAEKLKEDYNYTESLEYANIALTHAKLKDDPISQGQIYNIIGYNYQTNGELQKAVNSYEKALRYAKLSGEKRLCIRSYNILAKIYTKKDSSFQKAIAYYDESFKLAVGLRDTFEMITPLLNTAELHLNSSQYDLAHNFLLKANKYILRKGNDNSKSKINNLLARYFIHKKEYKKSEYHIKKAIEHAAEDNLYAELAAVYKTNSEYNYIKKRYKTAYNNLDLHYQNLNKVKDENRIRELDIANVKYKVEEYKRNLKQAEIEVIKRKSELTKWRITIILGSILIVVALAFLISSYRNNNFRKRINKDLIEKNKELQEAKDAAEQVSELKSQFISTVSHELRTPLYGVIGLTTLLMENPDKDKTNEYLESLKFSGDYLLALINDVLQLSKIETKEVKLERVSFNIKSLIDGIVNSLHSKQKHNNNQVHVQIDQEIAHTLVGDSIRISQILMNLIGNALKFTKNGNIWIGIDCISFANDVYKLRFTIKDDGIGIPIEKQKTIFDNFAQAQSINEEYQGTGLGLAIVEKLIHLFDSQIYLESASGKGSLFYFDLELSKAKEQENTTKQGETLHVGTTKFHVLVVDDNKINQIVTQNILKKRGHTSKVAGNGLDAIDMLKKDNYDLVLMDINMPGMNGLDATKAIRVFNKEIPIIALTAVEEGEVKEQVLEAGMNDLIVKPYDTQQFFQSIIKNIERVKLMSF